MVLLLNKTELRTLLYFGSLLLYKFYICINGKHFNLFLLSQITGPECTVFVYTVLYIFKNYSMSLEDWVYFSSRAGQLKSLDPVLCETEIVCLFMGLV